MPVSSPSYFPPNTSTDQVTGINAGHLATGAPRFLAGANAGNNSSIARLIIIGDNSGKAGLTDAFLAGTIILGDSSGQALVAKSQGSGTNSPGAITILGDSSFSACDFADSCVIIGQSVYAAYVGSPSQNFSANVLIGNGVGQGNGGDLVDSVIIGHAAFPGNAANSSQNVFIGSKSMQSATTGASFTANVIIGYLSCQQLGSTSVSGSHNVAIGSGVSLGTAGSLHVVIGDTASCSTGGSGSEGNVGIGANCICGATSDAVGGNVVLGSGARIPATTANGQNVIIGANAGATLPTASFTQFVVEINNTAHTSQSALLYGNFVGGNLILGGSKDGTNRDFGGVAGTNMVKLLNGTAATGAAITNGGYFTVLAGVLSWIDQNGIVSQLSQTAAGELDGSATVPYTNNAAAQAATMLNGPTAGNPTKWIPINDNGTIRNIPAW
jgi:hypothetical protein